MPASTSTVSSSGPRTTSTAIPTTSTCVGVGIGSSSAFPVIETRAIDVDARPGTKIDVGDKLAKIPGAAQYGSYDEPIPSGAVRRFWGKRGNATDSITDESEIYGSGERRYRMPPRDRDDDRYSDDRDRDDDRDYDVDEDSDRPAPRDDVGGTAAIRGLHRRATPGSA